MSSIKQLLRKRPILVLLLVAVILLIGNALAHTSETRTATAQNPTPVVVDSTLKEKISQLPEPNIGLPAKKGSPPPVYSKAYIVLDNESKYPLATKNPDMALPIASTTKIMTTLVVLDSEKDLDRVVTVTNKAATITGSEIQLLTGEQMTIHNLLRALMMNSANDAAYSLADASGSIDGFVAKMNKKAQSIGLRNTHYNDPAGLDDGGHSSPRDLAVLFQYALTKPQFREIVGTAKYTIWSADNKYKHDLTNSNRLIDPEQPLYLSNALGGKTGFTYEAGHCLVAAAKGSDGKTYVAVVLNTTEYSNEASAKEARKLLMWATQ